MFKRISRLEKMKVAYEPGFSTDYMTPVNRLQRYIIFLGNFENSRKEPTSRCEIVSRQPYDFD
jgi:hypothetical protein